MFLHASKADRRGPVGDVCLARAAECIEYMSAASFLSDTPLAARRITSAVDRGVGYASWRCLVRPHRKLQHFWHARGRLGGLGWAGLPGGTL